jgi:hypothetical protein
MAGEIRINTAGRFGNLASPQCMHCSKPRRQPKKTAGRDSLL